MRILYIVHQFMPEFAGGTETVALNLARSARSGGHYVEVLTAAVRDEVHCFGGEVSELRRAVVDGTPVYAIPMHERDQQSHLGFDRNAAAALLASRFLDSRAAYDLVHVVHGLRMIDVVEVIRARGTPYIITLTDFFLDCFQINHVRYSGEPCCGSNKGKQCIASCLPPGMAAAKMTHRQARTRSILEGAASVSACSTYVAESFSRQYPGVRVRVVNHGIDLLCFKPRTDSRAAAEVVFGYIGTISPGKGVHILAQAFAAAAPAKARLEIVGPCYDSAFRAIMKDLVAGSSAISLHEPIPAQAVAAKLNQFDVLCLPSCWPETFSLALHEGFAASLPCLVSDTGWPPRVVREYDCGWVAPPGDVEAWAAAIFKLAGDPEERRAKSQRVPLPRRVEEEGFIYDQLYRRVAAGGAAQARRRGSLLQRLQGG